MGNILGGSGDEEVDTTDYSSEGEESLMILGQTALEQQNWAKALNIWNNLEKVNPKNPASYQGKIRCYQEKGNLDEAVKICELAIERDIESSHKGAGWIFYKGILLVQNGKMAEGQEFIDKGLKVDPTHEAAIETKLGIMAMQGKTAKDWLEPLENALKANNQLWAIHCLKAMAYVKLKQLDEALESWKTAALIDPMGVDNKYSKDLSQAPPSTSKEELEWRKMAVEFVKNQISIQKEKNSNNNNSITITKESLQTNQVLEEETKNLKVEQKKEKPDSNIQEGREEEGKEDPIQKQEEN